MVFVLGPAALLLVLIACTSGPNQHPTGDANPPGITPGQVVTQQGQAAVNLYLLTFVIATIVFVLVEGLLLLIALRFRRRKTDVELPTQTHGNNNLEFLWTIVPAITVTVLFVAALITLTTETEARSPNPGLTVEVTGFQWQWTFAYPEYQNTAGKAISFTGSGSDGPTLVVPINEPIRFRVTGQDVIHSFYVPQFFYKKDAIPGRTNEFDLTIKDPGTYGGQCAEFCGLNHSQMYFTVNAVTRTEFDSWAANAQSQANATPPPAPSGAAKIQLKAVSVQAGFDPSTLTAPADSPLAIELVNSDTTAPHNVGIRKGNPDGTDWVGTPFANAGQTALYQAPALKAGTYEFFCQIHPIMKGTLTVGS
ncbi:MAG: cytochrome c oxidase subunit [Chloroflexota bacterium]|jgi:cytochrome c oxidase subunit 2|nr:cytochrome c oxidase subunit [Chloroflexota bacterium]